MRCIFWCLPYSSRVYYGDCRTISVLPLLRCCRHQSCLGLSLPSSCHIPSLSCSFSSCPSLSLTTIRTGWSGGTSTIWLFIQLNLLLLYVLKCVIFLNMSTSFLPNFCSVINWAVSPGENKPLMLIPRETFNRQASSVLPESRQPHSPSLDARYVAIMFSICNTLFSMNGIFKAWIHLFYGVTRYVESQADN